MPAQVSPKGYRSWAPLQSPATLQGRRFLFCLTAAWEEAGCDRSFSVPSLLRGTRGNLEQQMLEKPDHFHFCRAEAKTCSLDEKNDLSRGCALITRVKHLSVSTLSKVLILLGLDQVQLFVITCSPVPWKGHPLISSYFPSRADGWSKGWVSAATCMCSRMRCWDCSGAGRDVCCPLLGSERHWCQTVLRARDSFLSPHPVQRRP